MFLTSRLQQLQCLLGCLWLPVTNYGIDLVVVRTRVHGKRKSKVILPSMRIKEYYSI